ncbi:MAG TPA: hypothetical protein VLF40_04925 [Candidatus Saccharimonadales bacterium]|nr:hypothetical protein [Candidatus Saccharimonadales bacterium]
MELLAENPAPRFEPTEHVIVPARGLVSPIMVRTYENAPWGEAVPEGQDPWTIVMCNGAFKSRGTVEPFIEGFLAAAQENGVAVRFITYDEPKKARDYTAAERMRRFNEVMIYAAGEVDIERGELAVLGHSIGSTAILAAGLTLQEDERVGRRLKGVTLVTPLGIAPESQPRNTVQLAGRAAVEAATSKGAFRPSDLKVLGSVVRSMGGRFLFAPRESWRMVSTAIFWTDNRERLQQFCKEAVFDVSAVLAENDAMVLAGPTKDGLLAAGVPEENISILRGATHPSTITDRLNGARIFEHMFARATAQRRYIPRHAAD